MTQCIKKFNKTQKSPIKPQKSPIKPKKTHMGLVFLIKPGFLPALEIKYKYIDTMPLLAYGIFN